MFELSKKQIVKQLSNFTPGKTIMPRGEYHNKETNEPRGEYDDKASLMIFLRQYKWIFHLLQSMVI